MGADIGNDHIDQRIDVFGLRKSSRFILLLKRLNFMREVGAVSDDLAECGTLFQTILVLASCLLAASS